MSPEIAKATLVDEVYIELKFLRENITLDVDEVMEGWGKAQELSPDKKNPVLVVTGKWTLLEKAARDFVMNELKTWPLVAFKVDNLGQRIMGHVVINLSGKGNRIKLFDNEVKAREWLIAKTSKN